MNTQIQTLISGNFAMFVVPRNVCSTPAGDLLVVIDDGK